MVLGTVIWVAGPSKQSTKALRNSKLSWAQGEGLGSSPLTQVDRGNGGQRCSNESWKKNSRQPRDFLKQTEWQPKNKTQLTLSWRDVEEGEMLKYDDDQWEPHNASQRSMWQRFRVLRNLCSELSIYGSTRTTKWEGDWSSLYQSCKEEGQEMDSQHDTLDGRSWIPAAYTANRVSKNFTIILWLGNTIQ